MPVSCAAFGCKSRYNLETREKGITFHRFPKSNPILLDKWRLAMKRATSTGELWMPSRYQRLCSLHFEENCFDTTGQTKRLRDDVIPSIFNFHQLLQPQQTARRTVLKRWNSESGNVSSINPAVELTPSKTCASVSQDHIYSIPNVEALKRKLQACEEARAQKERELRNAKDREKRMRQVWPNIFKELTEKNLMTPQLNEHLLACGDIPLELFRRPESEYSVQQRLFALTLHLYGPKAYEYIRHELKLPLPGPRKLRCWLTSVDGSPGINLSFLEALLQKKNEKPEDYTRVCLTMDTMAIQQHISYDAQKKAMVGFINLGLGAEASGIQDVASEVMVLMLVSIVGDWKVPIAYFLTDTLTAEATKQLVLHTLHNLCDFGFEIVALTVDGHYINEQICTLLGCNFTDPRELKPYFSIPGRKQKCYVIFDAYHEWKLMCSLLKTYGTIQSPYGTIMWQYIDELQNMHKDSELCAYRKSTGRHARLFSQVLRVGLLVQSLSRSIATTLTTLNELEYEKFADCMATVYFIQVVNRLYDILTSNSPRIKGDKGPINGMNLQNKLDILQETKEYLLSLTVDNKPLYEISRKNCVFGFLVTISSFISLLPSLLLAQEYVVLHKFSQDYLRLFFYSVQKSGGWDNTPTAFNFKQVVSRLLLRCRLKDGLLGSIPYKDGIHGVSTFEEENFPCCFQQKITMPFEDNSIMLPDHYYSSRVLHVVIQNSAVYIAGWVVQKALCKISCDACRNCLVKEGAPKDFTNAYHLLQLKANGGLFVPSEGTIKTILTAEWFLKHIISVHSPKYSASQLLLQHEVLSEIGNTDIFNLKGHILETESGIDNHHYQLLRLLTSIYYVLCQPYFSKIAQLKVYKSHMRHILLKPLHKVH